MPEFSFDGAAVAGTEVATFLFTDLVDSTALTMSLGSEDAESLRRTHFTLLRSALPASGGTEVKNLGDGLMVIFPSASDGVTCAIAMHHAIQRHNRQHETALAVRFGLAAGEATAEDGDYFGEPVIEAARLCAVARGGQILVTDMVRALARRSGHRFVDGHEMALKGLPDPVLVWDVSVPAAEPDAHMPLPGRLAMAPRSGVVGRSAEQQLLEQAVKEAAAGSQRTILVGGEAGVGKSTLVGAVARAAHEGGAVVLYGRCDEDLAIPYQPFVEALTHYVSHASDDDLAGLEPDDAGPLARLLPTLRRRWPDALATVGEDAESERWLLFAAVARLLETAGRRHGAVVVLDDVHWADATTLQLVRYLASGRAPSTLMLATYRDAELSAAHPLTETLAALSREPTVQRVPLGGLDDAEVVSLMEAVAGHTLDDEGTALAHALHRETDGNPFFVTEVLRHLVETGAVVQRTSGRWETSSAIVDAGLPDSVRQVIGARVGRLGPEVARVLTAAAVIGQEFSLDLVAAMVDRTEDEVLDALDTAGAASLTIEVQPGRFRFGHALIQHTLYADLGRTRQARLHAVAASVLEAQCGTDPGERAAELARHWLAASRPMDAATAARYARLAGDQSLAQLAPVDAKRWYHEALDALGADGDAVERLRCLVGLGEAERDSGDPAYRTTLLDAARLAQDLGEDALLIRAALSNNRGVYSSSGEVDTERVAALEAALAVTPVASPERVRVLATLASEETFSPDRDRTALLGEQALTLARKIGDPALLAEALWRPASGMLYPDQADRQLLRLEEATAIIDTLPNPVPYLFAYAILAIQAVFHGDLTKLDHAQARMLAVAEKVDQPLVKWCVGYQMAWRRLLAGELERGEQLAGEALQLAEGLDHRDAFAFYAAHMVATRFHQGRLDEVLFIGEAVKSASPGLAPVADALIAAGQALDGDLDRARELLADAARSEFEIPRDPNWLTAMSGWAICATEAADSSAATTIYSVLAPWERLVSTAGGVPLVSVAHLLGELARVTGDPTKAEAHLRLALNIHAGLEAPFLIAHTQYALGRLLVENGSAEGQELLDAARTTAQARGYARLLRD